MVLVWLKSCSGLSGVVVVILLEVVVAIDPGSCAIPLTDTQLLYAGIIVSVTALWIHT